MTRKISSRQRAENFTVGFWDGQFVTENQVADIWLAGWAARGKADIEIVDMNVGRDIKHQSLELMKALDEQD